MNHWDHESDRPTAASPASGIERPNPLRRRRWIPATALVGGVLGAGIFLASTASAAMAVSDDGGTSSSTTSTAPSVSDAGIPPVDGTAPTPPAGGPAADGTAPTPPNGGPAADGTAPTPPVEGSGPTPPADGTAPTPPAGGPARGPGGPAGGPVADGSTAVVGVVAASSDTGITVQPDNGDSVTATFTSDTRFAAEPPAPSADPAATPTEPTALTAADFVLGSRVEIRVLDGNIVSARLVTAHADGTLTALSGSTGTVTTREGLKIALDLSGVSTTAVAGDEVHVRGAVDSSGTTIVVTSIEVRVAK